MNSDNRTQPVFSISSLSRSRWNVLDLMQVVGKGSIPTYLLRDVDMTWAENLRERLRRNGHRTTVTSILVKAIALAQRAHPESRTNALPGGRKVTFHNIVAGLTVEKFVGSEPAIFFGTIKSPDEKSVEEIATELRAYAERSTEDVPQLALENKFTRLPWFLRQVVLWASINFPWVRLKCNASTFGLTSLGKFGCQSIFPPCVNTSTFGVGIVEDRAVVRDGKIVIRPMMTLTLTFDHRIIDGAPAARFLHDVVELLEGGLERFISAEENIPAAAASCLSQSARRD